MARKRYVAGLEHAQRTFRRITPAAQEALTDALNRSAMEGVKRVQALTPVDTGNLRDATQRTPITSNSRGVSVTIQNTDFKARWVEFGTTQAPAQPFFWPAIRSLRRRMTNRVKRALNAAAKEIARGR